MTLTVVEMRKAAINPKAVDLLRGLLAKAESGELQAIAIAGLLRDGCSTTSTSGTNEAFGPISTQALLGAVAILQERIIRDVLHEAAS